MTTGAMTVTIVRGNTYRYNRTIKSHGFRFDYGRKIWFSFPAATPDVFDRLSKSVGKGCIVEHRDVLEFWFPEKASLSYPITRCDEPIVDHQFVSVWTDGGCWPNPGIGGWAYVIVLEDGQLIEDCGFEENTTNNRMELMGPIKALQRLPVGCTVKLTSDSQYMLDGLTTWIDGWKSNGWRRKKSNGKDAGPVSNVDLWKELDELASALNLETEWVKGHAGFAENERCDELASYAAYCAAAGIEC